MIYLLEDDSAIRELVVYTLCSTGLEATGFAAPSEFYDAMERALPELLILDIMLPDEDGREIVAKLRRRPETKKLPVIMVTAKSTEIDKVTTPGGMTLRGLAAMEESGFTEAVKAGLFNSK